MGTRNAGCALTGLEIVEDTPAYLVVLMADPLPYEGHWTVGPPLLGIYDGVDGITLTENVPSLGLSKGDVWPVEEDRDDKYGVAYIHPVIFDALGTLPSEGSEDKTLSDVVAEHLARMRHKLKNPDLNPNRDKSAADQEIIDMIATAQAIKLQHRSIWLGASDAIGDHLHDEALLDHALELNGRAYLLRHAEAELRHPLVPVNWGVAETRDAARLAIYELALSIARKRTEQDKG